MRQSIVLVQYLGSGRSHTLPPALDTTDWLSNIWRWNHHWCSARYHH